MTNLVIWGADQIEANTIEQAERTARLPFIQGHVALMPDAHFGFGSTVGSVIPTRGAIIPAAVGVDIGCGMIATRTRLTSGELPDDLSGLVDDFHWVIPAGVGKGHTEVSTAAAEWIKRRPPVSEFSHSDTQRALNQFGTLGSGNHFVEVCLDETDAVWIVLHSGSRGIGNRLAQQHIDTAKKLMERMLIGLEDPDLAYLPEGTPECQAYLADLLWAQDYALANREQMMNAAVNAVARMVSWPDEYSTIEGERINCHHNYAARENHHGKNVWITRKGAIRARLGDMGVIPGSMGAASYIVRGLGNPTSYDSCSHGAGRRMSRGRAKRELTVESLREAMVGKAWLDGQAKELLDEHPDAYKDIDAVMEAQKDLVEIVHTLHQVANYKGL